MIDLDLRRLDDHEPPVATEQRLGASIVRGHALRRKHNLAAIVSATAAVMVVIAMAGVIGLARPQLVVVNPAGQAPPTSVPAPMPSAQPYEISADGIDPYMLGADATLLEKEGLLAGSPALIKCPAAYAPLGKYAKEALRVGVTGDRISLVMVASTAFHSPSLVTVGMTEDKLKRTINAAQLVQVPSASFEQAYVIGRPNAMAFAFTAGRIKLMVAGNRELLTQLLRDGTLATC